MLQTAAVATFGTLSGTSLIKVYITWQGVSDAFITWWKHTYFSLELSMIKKLHVSSAAYVLNYRM